MASTVGYKGRMLQRTRTVLVVDDDKVIRSFVKSLLRQYGYTVIAANNGHHALSLCSYYKDAIDLILVDIFMPYLNGFELIDGLRSVRNDFQVLYMSDRMSLDHHLTEHQRVIEEFHFLMKPVKAFHLLQMVDEAVGNRTRDFPSVKDEFRTEGMSDKEVVVAQGPNEAEQFCREKFAV
jgi:DNA-binding NtrC family response regulator